MIDIKYIFVIISESQRDLWFDKICGIDKEILIPKRRHSRKDSRGSIKSSHTNHSNISHHHHNNHNHNHQHNKNHYKRKSSKHKTKNKRNPNGKHRKNRDGSNTSFQLKRINSGYQSGDGRNSARNSKRNSLTANTNTNTLTPLSVSPTNELNINTTKPRSKSALLSPTLLKDNNDNNYNHNINNMEKSISRPETISRPAPPPPPPKKGRFKKSPSPPKRSRGSTQSFIMNDHLHSNMHHLRSPSAANTNTSTTGMTPTYTSDTNVISSADEIEYKFGNDDNNNNDNNNVKENELNELKIQIADLRDEVLYLKIQTVMNKKRDGYLVDDIDTIKTVEDALLDVDQYLILDKDWKKWRYLEIVEWITNLEYGRYQKYKQILYTNMKYRNMNGRYLNKMEKSDLSIFFGITDFCDICDLWKQIKILTART